MFAGFDDSMVSYEIECFPEDTDVRGNAMASGDDDYDREVEDSILADLSDGNDWAWCTVRVTARYDGVDCAVGQDYLGCCSYASREDFEACDYCADMKDQAREDLYTQLEGILYRFGCINPSANPECVEGGE